MDAPASEWTVVGRAGPDDLAREIRLRSAMIRSLRHEEAFAILRDGTVLHATGDERSVTFADEGRFDLAGAVLIHNHPTGGPLSFDDLRTAARLRLRTMIAVSPDGESWLDLSTEPSLEALEEMLRAAFAQGQTWLARELSRGKAPNRRDVAEIVLESLQEQIYEDHAQS